MSQHRCDTLWATRSRDFLAQQASSCFLPGRPMTLECVLVQLGGSQPCLWAELDFCSMNCMNSKRDRRSVQIRSFIQTDKNDKRQEDCWALGFWVNPRLCMGWVSTCRVCWIYVVFQGKTFVTRNVRFSQFPWIDRSMSVQVGWWHIHTPSLGDICLKYTGLQETCFLALGLKTLDSGRSMRWELVHQWLQICFLN